MLQKYLLGRGIETLVHYPIPIPDQPALASQRPARCPAAALACSEVLSLPLFPSIEDSDVAAVAAAIGEFVED
jgi:dTDP-4-amino-4,6-dideoxygalactose transaminase